MTTVLIPKNLTGKSDLVAVPRSAYAEFLAWQKRVKSSQSFKPTARELKELGEARKDFAAGKFVTLENIKHGLESSHSSKSK